MRKVDAGGSMRHPALVARRSSTTVPAGLRASLETARLDLLTLFRALDRMDLSPAEIPQRLLQQLFELDADYVEALWALDQVPVTLDIRVMVRDTLAALDQLQDAATRFRKNLPRRAHPALEKLELEIRKALNPREAYNMVPGRDSAAVWAMDYLDYDEEKIDECVLALMYLTIHDGVRAWKGFDWGALDRLHEKGFIANPKNKTKSVVLTEEGMARSAELFERLFSKPAGSQACRLIETRLGSSPRDSGSRAV